jgi:hypothetical protein
MEHSSCQQVVVLSVRHVVACKLVKDLDKLQSELDMQKEQRKGHQVLLACTRLNSLFIMNR